MSIRGRKPKKGSLGTSFIIEKIPGLKRISCSNCINYNVDKSCDVKHVLMSEIGYDYWKQCNQFELSNEFDTEENRALAERTRKRIEKTYKIDKNKQDKKRKSRGNSVKVIKVKNVTTIACIIPKAAIKTDIKAINAEGTVIPRAIFPTIPGVYFS